MTWVTYVKATDDSGTGLYDIHLKIYSIAEWRLSKSAPIQDELDYIKVFDGDLKWF